MFIFTWSSVFVGSMYFQCFCGFNVCFPWIVIHFRRFLFDVRPGRLKWGALECRKWRPAGCSSHSARSSTGRWFTWAADISLKSWLVGWLVRGLPSSKHTKSYWKLPFSSWISPLKWWFSTVMLVYQRVYYPIYWGFWFNLIGASRS